MGKKQKKSTDAEKTGRVERIIDGDTLSVFLQETLEHIKIRLKNIDAPEMSQNHGKESKENLERLLPPGTSVTIKDGTRDRYGRLVSKVIRNDQSMDVGLEQVYKGEAYIYPQYFDGDPRYSQAENYARKKGNGIWDSEQSTTKPWDYRKYRRQGTYQHSSQHKQRG